MLPGTHRDRVRIQHRTKTQVAGGVDETWANVELRSARVITLSPSARIEYAKVSSIVTHEVEFHGKVSLALGDDRLIWLTGASKILELVEPPRYSSGRQNCTRVAVREVV